MRLPLLSRTTVSALRRVEFPRPAALLQSIYAGLAGFGLPLRISNSARIDQRTEILGVTLRKCSSVGCPRLMSVPLGLGVATSRFRVARERWAQKEKTK